MEITISVALNLSFKNVIIAETLNCCGMEDRAVVAYSCPKTKKLICGMELGKCCGL